MGSISNNRFKKLNKSLLGIDGDVDLIIEENDVLISDLNQAAKALKKNGRFSEISMEYFGVDLLEDEE